MSSLGSDASPVPLDPPGAKAGYTSVTGGPGELVTTNRWDRNGPSKKPLVGGFRQIGQRRKLLNHSPFYRKRRSCGPMAGGQHWAKVPVLMPLWNMMGTFCPGQALVGRGGRPWQRCTGRDSLRTPPGCLVRPGPLRSSQDPKHLPAAACQSDKY